MRDLNLTEVCNRNQYLTVGKKGGDILEVARKPTTHWIWRHPAAVAVAVAVAVAEKGGGASRARTTANEVEQQRELSAEVRNPSRKNK
jgi:hypothetical protein